MSPRQRSSRYPDFRTETRFRAHNKETAVQHIAIDLGGTESHAALKHPDGVPAYVERLLKVIESMNEQIVIADKELARLAQEDVTCQRLMSVLGGGTCYQHAVRRSTRRQVALSHSAFGASLPRPNTWRELQLHTRTAHRYHQGRPSVGTQSSGASGMELPAASSCGPISRWRLSSSNDAGKFIATVAVARKLAGVLFALWRDGSTYDINHGMPAPPR